jgi:hypothetical protein
MVSSPQFLAFHLKGILNMKKIVAGLFVGAFSLAVVGCDEEPKKPAPAPAKAAEPAKDAKK